MTEGCFYLQQAELLGPELQGGRKRLEVGLLPPDGEGFPSAQSERNRRIGRHDADVTQQLAIKSGGKKTTKTNKKKCLTGTVCLRKENTLGAKTGPLELVRWCGVPAGNERRGQILRSAHR